MSTATEKHLAQTRMVATLAEAAHRPTAEVAKLYEHECTELTVGAHITTYVPIFAFRKVQQMLRLQAIKSALAAAAVQSP
jgi:hypothetical protein